MPLAPDPSTPALASLVAHPILAAGLLARLLAALTVGALPLGPHAPARVKVALAAALTLVALPAAVAAAPHIPPTLPRLLLTEAFVGLAMGLVTALVVASAAWAGAVAGSVAGVSWSGDFSVGGEEDAGGTARLAWWCGVAAFFATGGHLVVVAGLLDSVRLVPLGVASLDGGAETPLAHAVMAVPALALELALAVAAPALAAVVAFHVAAAIALRTLGFAPGQGLLQAAAALVVVAALVAGAEVWLGGFGTAAGELVGRGFAAVAGR